MIYFGSQLECKMVIVYEKRTYNNVVKATKMIERKGYSHEEANEIAIQIFDESEQSKKFYVNRMVY